MQVMLLTNRDILPFLLSLIPPSLLPFLLRVHLDLCDEHNKDRLYLFLIVSNFCLQLASDKKESRQNKLLMFRQKVGDPSTEVWRLSMSDKDFTVNDAIHL